MQRGDEGNDLAAGGPRVVNRRCEVRVGVGVAAKPSQHAPAQPRLDDAAIAVGELAHECEEFLAEAVDETVRIGRQSAGRDQQCAQVLQVPAGCQRIEPSVGARCAPTVQCGEDAAGSRSG
jgi:hypothetical protein